MKTAHNEPRCLLYDIETSYIVGGTWGIWQTDVITVLQDWQILCFAYKWLGDKRTYVIGQDDFKDYKPGKLNDKQVVEALWELFNEADVVIAHNGNSFDQKKVQARMMVHHMPPPRPYKQIDTKNEMKKVAAHTSNKLDDLNRALGIEQKLATGGLATWTGCMNGEAWAWKKMKRYNKGDIRALEELYLQERPWMKTHPAMNLMAGDINACPKCGGGPLTKNGYYFSNSNRIQVWTCKNCGGHPRSRQAEKTPERVLYVN